MANQHCWIKTADKVCGPFAPTSLRQFAANGSIDPDTLISLDGIKWVPAGKARGLFPDLELVRGSSAPPPPRQDPDSAKRASHDVRYKEKSQPRPSGVDLNELLPLIRVKRTLWKTEIVAL
jgi:hypothetical protein